MILELFLVLAGLAMIFFIASIGLILARRSAVVPLIIAGLLLLTSGTVIAAEGIQIYNGVNETCTEDSYYWNCTIGINNCTGTVAQDACTAYNNDQCLNIDNCTWTGSCAGTPTWTCEQIHTWGHQIGYEHNKCDETAGCTHSIIFDNAECDEIITNCNTSIIYTNYTGNAAAPDSEIDILYYALILSGLFLILWGAVQAWETREPFHQEED